MLKITNLMGALAIFAGMTASVLVMTGTGGGDPEGPAIAVPRAL